MRNVLSTSVFLVGVAAIARSQPIPTPIIDPGDYWSWSAVAGSAQPSPPAAPTTLTYTGGEVPYHCNTQLNGISFYPLFAIQCYATAVTVLSGRVDISGVAVEGEGCTDALFNEAWADNEWWDELLASGSDHKGVIDGGGTLSVASAPYWEAYYIVNECQPQRGCYFEDNAQYGGLSTQPCSIGGVSIN